MAKEPNPCPAGAHKPQPPPAPPPRTQEEIDRDACIERWGEVKGQQELKNGIEAMMDHLEQEGWDALVGYDFVTFATCATGWAFLNTAGGFGQRNPFRQLVNVASDLIEDKAGERPADLAVCDCWHCQDHPEAKYSWCGCDPCTCVGCPNAVQLLPQPSQEENDG